MNYSSGLSKQKHRSVYSCSSRADHTILFHLEYILSAAMISDLVRCWFSGDAWFGSRFWFWPDNEEQSMLAAKTGAKAKTVSMDSEKAAVRQQLRIQFMK